MQPYTLRCLGSFLRVSALFLELSGRGLAPGVLLCSEPKALIIAVLLRMVTVITVTVTLTTAATTVRIATL